MKYLLAILPLFAFSQYHPELSRGHCIGLTGGSAYGVHYEFMGQLRETSPLMMGMGAEILSNRQAPVWVKVMYKGTFSPFAAVHYVITRPSGNGVEGGLTWYTNRLAVSGSYRWYEHCLGVRSGVWARLGFLISK